MSDLIEVLNQDTLFSEEQIVSFIEVNDEDTLVVSEDVISLVSEAVQGPQGIQGIQGPAGSISATYVASTSLSGHRIVTLNSTGQATYANNNVQLDSNRLVGMTTGAVIGGGIATVQSMGELTEPGWSWDVSLPVYLGIDGLLTQVTPVSPAASFSAVVGFPISPTTLHLNIGPSIALTS